MRKEDQEVMNVAFCPSLRVFLVPLTRPVPGHEMSKEDQEPWGVLRADFDGEEKKSRAVESGK